jgi:hypothetical protein
LIDSTSGKTSTRTSIRFKAVNPNYSFKAMVKVFHDQGLKILAKLATLPFSVALFGHGRTIPSGAAEKFARKWGTA